MTASEEFRPMVEAAGARFVPLPVSLTAHIATKKGQRSLNRGWYPAMRGVHQLFHRHRVGIEDALLEAAEEADVLVTVLNTHDRAQCLAVANQIPHAFVQFFPVLPTREFPAPMLTRKRVPSTLLRLATHYLTIYGWWLANFADNRAFARRLGLSRVPPSTVHACADPGTPVLQAYSPILVRKPRDWSENHFLTGFWQLPAGIRAALDEEDLPDGLDTWLDAGEPPVFLGFGSMPVRFKFIS